MARGDHSLTHQIKARAKKVIEEVVEAVKVEVSRFTGRLVSSGCTMLNLACSDTPWGAFLLGSMINVVGDKGSSKTTTGLSVLAEATQDPNLDDYRLIFDDVEAANEFDVSAMFGHKLAKRIEPPSKDGASDTVADLQNNLLQAIKQNEPFIYVLDSFDALTTDEELDRAYAKADGKEVKGSYGMQKAKGASELFRIITRELKGTKSLFIIISQVRENIDPMSFKKYRRVGGKALDFYASHILWLGNVGTVKKHDRVVGHEVRASVDKNKINGKLRIVDYQTFDGYGIDDIGSMVDFMIREKLWKPKKAKEEKKPVPGKRQPRMSKVTVDKASIFVATDLAIEGNRSTLIRLIEEQELVKALREEVAAAWMSIEDSLRPARKPKY